VSNDFSDHDAAQMSLSQRAVNYLYNYVFLFIAILVVNVRRIAIDMIKKPKSFRTLHIFFDSNDRINSRHKIAARSSCGHCGSALEYGWTIYKTYRARCIPGHFFSLASCRNYRRYFNPKTGIKNQPIWGTHVDHLRNSSVSFCLGDEKNYSGQRNISPVHGAIYILVLAPFVIGEKFHWRDLVTVIFCIGGMSLFFVGKLEVADYQGNIAALFSGVFLGLYIMLLKHPRAGGNAERGTRNAESADNAEGGVRNAELSTLPSSVSDELGMPSSADESNSAFRVPHSTFESAAPLNPAIAVIYGNFLLAFLTFPSGIAALPVMAPLDWLAVSFLGIIQIGIAYVLFIKA
jgi:hypothetical protein